MNNWDSSPVSGSRLNKPVPDKTQLILPKNESTQTKLPANNLRKTVNNSSNLDYFLIILLCIGLIFNIYQIHLVWLKPKTDFKPVLYYSDLSTYFIGKTDKDGKLVRPGIKHYFQHMDNTNIMK